MKPTVTFDGATATLTDVPAWVHQSLYELLSWQDSSIGHQNYRNRNSKWFKPQDATRSAYNLRTYRFPTGLVPRVVARLRALKIEPEQVRDYIPTTVTKPEIPDWAFDHQREAVTTALTTKRCLIQAPAGSGKTYTLAFLASAFPEAQILVTIHSSDIFKGLYQTFSEYFQEPIGQIGDKKKNWQRITIGMQKSLALYAHTDFKERLQNIDVLLTDECHHFGCSEGLKVSLACPKTSYRVGVSATVKRTDGADFLVEGAFGPLALVIPESKMVALGVIHAPKACFVPVPALELKTVVDIERAWSSNPREGFYQEGIVRNLQRNQLVVELLLAFLDSPTRGGNALLLVERIEHGQELQKLLAARGKRVEFIEGTNTKSAVRDKWLEALKRQEIDALISSAILDEGVDIPGLEVIFNAAGGSCERAVVQRAGRPGRIDRVGNKTRCLYIDFDDQEPAFLNKNARFRQLHINARFPGCVQKVSVSILKKIFNEP